MFRKITSFILAFIMVLSMVPVQVFATETEAVAETVVETMETEPTETESVPETEETTAPIETESVAETEPAEPETSPEETLPGDEEGDTEETFAAFSETSGTCGENVTWTLADGVLTISGTGAMMEYDNQWDAPWYKNSEEIIKIIIEYGVTSIGDLSFAYCSNMMSVALANSVITIGENAFYGCKSLNSIAIPASITKIESFAFYNCKNLETVIFTGNAPYISTIAFGTDTITVYYPEDNSSWTETVDQAYYDYITWKPYFLGNHKIVIDTVVLPTCAIGGLTEGYHCSICGEIIIAQEGIHTLKHSFEEGICLNCGMQGGKCGENVEWALSSEGILKITGSGAMNDYQYDCYHFLDTVSPSRDCIREIIVGEGITSIGDLAFYNCSYSERVTLPDSVTRIGQAAFGCCKNLEEVVLPPRINEISDSLFSQCEKLKNVEINGITKIGAGAFSGCKSLTDFDIPHGVSIIRDYTFSGCEKLVNLSIPNTVTRIGNFAFAGCKSLKNVSLPESLKYLYTGAFEECTALKTVILSRNFQSIGNRAFYGCVNLTEIELPYGVDSVNEYAFYGCKNLQSIRFPESVMWIGIEAFDGCKALSEIYFVGDAPDTEANIFKDVTASVFYSNKNNTWTKSAKQQYGGKLTWIATDPIALHKTIIIPGTEPTCTEDGLTDYIYCSICNEIFSQHEKIPPLGHTEVVDPQLAPTCTKDGLSEGSHCSVCGEIIEAQMVVAALGHSAVVDDAVSPTCTKNGLLQGTHCKVCSEVLVPQEEIPALGHKFLTEASGFVCMVCGEKATLNFMQEYILLQTDEEFDLRSIVFPTEISEYVEWVLEGDSDSILIRENGTVVAKKKELPM